MVRPASSSGRCWRARGASSRLWVYAVELRREGGALTNVAQNRRPTVPKTPPPPTRTGSVEHLFNRDGVPHGLRGGVVEVICASTADLACAVVVCGATQQNTHTHARARTSRINHIRLRLAPAPRLVLLARDAFHCCCCRCLSVLLCVVSHSRNASVHWRLFPVLSEVGEGSSR